MSAPQHTKLPPGPRGTLGTTYRIMTDPEQHYPRWLERYGDPFTVRGINGIVVLTARPDVVKRVFSSKPGAYGVFAARPGEIIAGPSSVLITEGEKHTRDRKLLMPPFHGDRMRAYGEIMAEAANEALDQALGQPPTTGDEMGRQVSLQVILRAVFGLSSDAERDEVEEAVQAAMATIHPSFLFAPMLQREGFGLLPYARFRKADDHANALLMKKIAAARDGAEDREDILSMLLTARYDDGEPMPDIEVRDQLRTLLVAGHETTAITLAWALYELCRNPGALARAQEEADAAEGPADLARAEWLTAVVRETLRLHPIAVEVIRQLREPMEIDDYVVPAGANIAPCIMLAHQNPEVFPQPEKFDPERFVDRTYSPFEFMPFGGGDRRCIGAAFAEYEMRIALGIWLRRARFELLDDGPVRAIRKNIVMAPEGGVRLAVTPRAVRP